MESSQYRIGPDRGSTGSPAFTTGANGTPIRLQDFTHTKSNQENKAASHSGVNESDSEDELMATVDSALLAEAGLGVDRDMDILMESAISSDSSRFSDLRRAFSPGVQLFVLATIIGVLMKGTSKYILKSVSPAIAIQVRMSMTSLITSGLLRYNNIEGNLWGPPKMRGILMCRGVLGATSIFLAYFCLKYLTLPDFAMIGFITPILTGIAGRIFLHERYVWQQLLLGIVAFLGVVVIARPPLIFGYPEGESEESGNTRMHEIAVLVAILQIFISTAVVILLRFMGPAVHALATVANYSFFSAVLATGWLILHGKESFQYPTDTLTWTLLIIAGLAGFGLNYLTPRALQLEEASVLSTWAPIEIVFAVIFEAAVFKDWPDAWSVLGGVIVITSVLYSATFSKETRKEESKA